MLRRFATVFVVVAAVFGVIAPSADAHQPGGAATLAALWTKVLQTPSAQNAFGSGGPSYACWNLGKAVAPLGPSPVPSCTIGTGTQIFISASTGECSTFVNDCPPPNSSEQDLVAGAKKLVDATAPPVTLDGKPVTVTFVQTGLLNIVLPDRNILSAPAGAGHSVALGWVALVHPLPPGAHIIHVITTNPPLNYQTTINVQPGR